MAEEKRRQRRREAEERYRLEVSYFPGCSMATTAKESNQSLVRACQFMGLKMTEVDDWNCCGSSSAHSLDPKLALSLAARNLSRCPEDRPLLIMCPACYKNLAWAHTTFKNDRDLRRTHQRRWGGRISPDLKIVTFLEIAQYLEKLERERTKAPFKPPRSLAGLKVAPYYGCMSMYPPELKHSFQTHGTMENMLRTLGAEVITWPALNRCCGTFLAAVRPEVVSSQVTGIMDDALNAGADCLVTACAMCQLNMEMRIENEQPLPTLHFSEVLALSLGSMDYWGWFARHLVDPRPLLIEKGLIQYY